MAKKKNSQKKEAAPMAEPTNDHTANSNGRDTAHSETKGTASRDPSPDKTERLKQLNQILLIETKEKREKVSQLLSQIEEMSVGFSFASENEREIVHVVLSAYVTNLSIEINERLREMEEERKKEVQKGMLLERVVESLQQKAQAEMEKGRLAEQDKTEILGQLDMKEKEVVEMGKMVKDLEMLKSEIERRFFEVSEEKKALLEEGREKEGLICNLRNERNEVEKNLVECKKLLEKFKSEMDSRFLRVCEEKEALLEERREKEGLICNLRNEKSEVEKNLGECKKLIEKLKSEVDSRFLKVCEEKEALLEERREKEGLICNLRNEKNEVEKNLGECKKLVEKFEIKIEEEVKDKEQKVSLLKNEKGVLEAKILTLERENAIEISELSSKTEVLNHKNAEKEGEIRDLKATIDGKSVKIVGLEKEIDVLQLAIEEAKKKGGFWSWIYPAATTILAAISFAYAARAR